MKAIVISGGGSKGAFGGGMVQYLVNDLGNDYQILAGTSTGSLLCSLIAVHEIDRLKESYTSVTQDDIFSVNPFKIKKKADGIYDVGINPFKVAWNLFVKKRKSFGDTHSLRKKIESFFTEKDFTVCNKAGKDFIVCVTNFTTGDKEYKHAKDCTYSDFCDWMWASASVPPFMTLVEKNGFEYVDGGLRDHLAIQAAIDAGATEIDVIDLKLKLEISLMRNVFSVINRAFDVLLDEVASDDSIIGQLEAHDKHVTINYWGIPRRITNNSLVFDKEAMLKWWEEGYEYAKTTESKKYTILSKKEQ